MLNKLRHQFPDENECRQQLIMAIETDRLKKRDKYVNQWNEVSEDLRSEMQFEMFLRYLGQSTGFTNRMQPEGLTPTIAGQTLCYDSFDINFRKLSHVDWLVKYDPSDLSKVLVINADSKNGKLINEVGTYQFILEQKYMQPMALAERNDGDAFKLQEVKDFNQNVMQFITSERQQNSEILQELFQRPQLEDTLAKLILVDSRGQHKDRRNENRLADRTKELIEVQTVQNQKESNDNWLQQQSEYNKSKINLNDYL